MKATKVQEIKFKAGKDEPLTLDGFEAREFAIFLKDGEKEGK